MTPASRPAALRYVDVDLSGWRHQSSPASTGKSSLGDRWVVLGPNGSGKTTLVQLASGYLHPTRGRVESPRPPPGERRRTSAAGGDRYRFGRRLPHDRAPPDGKGSGGLGQQGRPRTVVAPLHRGRMATGRHFVGVRRVRPDRRATLRRAVRGRAPTGHAGSSLDGRAEALVTRRALRGPGHGRPRAAAVTSRASGAGPRSTPDRAGHSPCRRNTRKVSPTSCCSAPVASSRPGPIASTLSPQSLSECFGLPLELRSDDHRWTSRAARRIPEQRERRPYLS